MKQSITLKISLVIALCLIGVAISMITISNNYVMEIIDSRQTEVYAGKIERIQTDITRIYNELKESGLEEAYRESAQEEFIDSFKKQYYHETPVADDTQADTQNAEITAESEPDQQAPVKPMIAPIYY